MHFPHKFLFIPALAITLLSGCNRAKQQTPSTQSVAKEGPLVDQMTVTTQVQSHGLPAGVTIPVVTLEIFDSETVRSQFLVARIEEDVKGPDGLVALPAGTAALVVVREVLRLGTKVQTILGLNRVEIAGKTYSANGGGKDLATLILEEDAAKGIGHRSVHLERLSRVVFKLDTPLQLK